MAVSVSVGVGVTVSVEVGVSVTVEVLVDVCVFVGVMLGVEVDVPVAVGVALGVGAEIEADTTQVSSKTNSTEIFPYSGPVKPSNQAYHDWIAPGARGIGVGGVTLLGESGSAWG